MSYSETKTQQNTWMTMGGILITAGLVLGVILSLVVMARTFAVVTTKPASLGQNSPGRAVADGQISVPTVGERIGTIRNTITSKIKERTTIPPIPQIPVSTADADETSPGVATDGVNFLAVWEDYRSDSEVSDIYGTLVDQQGNILNSNVNFISTGPHSQKNPAVAFNGINYFVVWEDYRSGNNWDIFGALVDRYGKVIKTNIDINSSPKDQRRPAIAVAKDGNFLVVWSDTRSTSTLDDIYGTIVSKTGVAQTPGGTIISDAKNIQDNPSVSFYDDLYLGDRYLVVWDDMRSGTGTSDIFGTKVDLSGNVQNNAGIKISDASNNQSYPSVAVIPEFGWIVIWQDERAGGNPDILGSRVNYTGEVWDKTGIAIAMDSDGHVQPDITWLKDDQYVLTWQTSATSLSSVKMAYMTFSNQGGMGGEIEPQDVFVYGYDALNSAAIRFLDSIVVVWQAKIDSSYDIYAKGFPLQAP